MKADWLRLISGMGRMGDEAVFGIRIGNKKCVKLVFKKTEIKKIQLRYKILNE